MNRNWGTESLSDLARASEGASGLAESWSPAPKHQASSQTPGTASVRNNSHVETSHEHKDSLITIKKEPSQTQIRYQQTTYS